MLGTIKTVFLLGLLSAILIGIGSFWGTNGLIIGFIFAILMNFFSYFFSDKLALAIYRAKPLAKNQHPELHEMVKEVAHKAGIPIPKIYIIPSEQPNAFATGRDHKHASVAYTQGILKLLNKEELKGVTAHEISHIKNYDILIQSVAATIASVISFIAMMARFAPIGDRDRNGSNILEFLVLAILTPLIATLIQLAISRTREYLADETGAKVVKNSAGLASALHKLETYSSKIPMGMGSKTTESMFIVNPFKGEALISLFSTHPPMSERIKRLNALKF